MRPMPEDMQKLVDELRAGPSVAEVKAHQARQILENFMPYANSTIPQRAARHVLAQLVDLRVPVSVEYLQGNAILSVPTTFAKTLDATCESVKQALADGVTPGSFS